jgi:spermidine synthase
MTQEGLIYFRDGELVASHGDARVYKMNGELFLEIGEGHTLWALESEITDYIEQLQDFPRGDCLEIGLGLGVVSRYLLTFPRVKSLTTVEINKDVIEVHKKIREEDRGNNLHYKRELHKILHADGIEYAYQTKRKYDFIFIDCYDRIDEDTLPIIADMAQACSRILKSGGMMLGWIDKYTPEEFYVLFKGIFDHYRK